MTCNIPSYRPPVKSASHYRNAASYAVPSLVLTEYSVMNQRGQFLLQQRVASARKFPNMWGQTGGGAQSGEDSWQCCIRESVEELGIKPDLNNSVFIGTFKRPKDFVDVWLVHSDANLNDLKLQQDEVQSVKWVSRNEIKDMLNQGIFIPSILPGLQMVYAYVDMMAKSK